MDFIGPGFVVGVLVLVFALVHLASAAKESGHLKAPRFGKRKPTSSFRQFPLHNPEDIE